MNKFLLDRRTVLRGAGASIALPWLEAMVRHEGRAAAATPARFAAVYFGNGVLGSYWGCKPGDTDTSWALSQPLSVLAKHRPLITYLDRMDPRDLRMLNDGHWSPASSFLTGIRFNCNSEGGGTRLYRPLPLGSLDQAIANVLGCTPLNMAPFPVVHPPGSSSAGNRGAGLFLTNISWKSQTEVAPRHSDSLSVYDALFKLPTTSQPPSPALAAQFRAARASVLDLVQAQTTTLKARLGAYDRQKMDQYLGSIREVERNIAAEAQAPAAPVSCALPARDGFADGNFDRANKNMADLIALAFTCNRTRVVTWMLDSEHSYDRVGVRIPGYSGPAAGDDYHIISHHGSAGQAQAFMSVNAWHAQKFLYLCDKLAAITEANGKTLLENSVLMYGAGMFDGNAHGLDRNVARILVGNGGGMFRSGRFIAANGAHHANLLLALAQKFGVATDRFGNSDGVLDL